MDVLILLSLWEIWKIYFFMFFYLLMSFNLTDAVRKNLCFLHLHLHAIKIEHCERVHVIAVAKRNCIANCRELCRRRGFRVKMARKSKDYSMKMVGKNPLNYASCFDYLRLLVTGGNKDRI
ncbi:hypothetical protein YC2023_043162 [Brassica napus]